jgi:hypothetical protein
MTDTSPEAVERFDINWRDYRKDIDTNGDYVTHEAYAALSAQLATAHAAGKAEGLRAAAAKLEHRYKAELQRSTADLLSDWKSHVASAWGQASAMVSALIPADTPAEHCTTCDGTGDVVRADGEWLGTCDCGANPLPADTPAAKVTVQEAIDTVKANGYVVYEALPDFTVMDQTELNFWRVKINSWGKDTHHEQQDALEKIKRAIAGGQHD